MPKDTFTNLNPGKRQQFLDEAFREFAERDYHSASVSRIVSRLGIAKGSLYQYFEDKRDLYFHLLELAAERKLEFIRERADAAAASGDFFDLHGALILAAVEFDFRYPRQGLIIMNALQEREVPELGSLARELGRRSTRLLEDYVLAGISKGTIRGDIDPRLTATVVGAAALAMAGYMETTCGFSLADQLRDPDRPLPFSDAELHDAVTALLELLRRGIAAPTREGADPAPDRG
jgi:AcrR family transcriptional regulator